MRPFRLTFLDHYDSFSRNVLELLRTASPKTEIQRIFVDDKLSLEGFVKDKTPLVISPGPGNPFDYPQTLSVVRQCLGVVPILGVCLGHQVLGVVHGSKMVRAYEPHHGATVVAVIDNSDSFFRGLPRLISVATYNSLVITPPHTGRVIARQQMTNEVEAVRYEYAAATYGVQFHPESYLSEYGLKIVSNWIGLCGGSKLNDLVNQVRVTDTPVAR